LTYKIKLVSQTNAIAFIITCLAIFLISAGTLLPRDGLQNGALSIFVVFIVAFIAYFLWQLFVTGRTVWTIDDNEIKIVWTKKFALVGGIDTVIKWSEIKDISQGPDPKYYSLKIKLVSGDTLKYFHDNLTTRDDFEQMLKTLYQTLNAKRPAANDNAGPNRTGQHQP
jgi:hypothetical protein